MLWDNHIFFTWKLWFWEDQQHAESNKGWFWQHQRSISIQSLFSVCKHTDKNTGFALPKNIQNNFNEICSYHVAQVIISGVKISRLNVHDVTRRHHRRVFSCGIWLRMIRATTSLPKQPFAFFIFHSAFLLSDQ